jgi:hypothetical protein
VRRGKYISEHYIVLSLIFSDIFGDILSSKSNTNDIDTPTICQKRPDISVQRYFPINIAHVCPGPLGPFFRMLGVTRVPRLVVEVDLGVRVATRHHPAELAARVRPVQVASKVEIQVAVASPTASDGVTVSLETQVHVDWDCVWPHLNKINHCHRTPFLENLSDYSVDFGIGEVGVGIGGVGVDGEGICKVS